MLQVTGLFAGILALMFVLLSINVIRGRYNFRVAVGDGGQEPMTRRIRAHGNFAEYMPLALVLIAINELQGFSATALFWLGMLLVAGRFSHAYSLIVAETRPQRSHIRFRQAGMAATFTVLIILGLALIF